MKYKVGDKVRIKSLEWYEKHHDYRGRIYINSEAFFSSCMVEYCGKEAIIKEVNETSYKIDIDNQFWNWSDGMFEDENPLCITGGRIVLPDYDKMFREKAHKELCGHVLKWSWPVTQPLQIKTTKIDLIGRELLTIKKLNV